MNYKEPSSLVQIQIKQPFVLLFSNFLPCFHGNPPADKPRMEQEAKLGEGCEKGRESKGRIWLGRTKMPTFVPPQRGGNHRNNSAGHGRSWAGGIPAKIVKWEENGKGGVKNTKPGPPVGPECLKNETK